MIFKYGTYAHANNEVEMASIERSTIRTEDRRRHASKVRYTIAGEIQADTQAELTTALAALELAYSKDGQDAGLYLDDGTTKTQHFLDSGLALGGVRVVSGPSYPVGTGAEYSTFRRYQITLEATFPDVEENLLAFIESVSIIGTTGPRFIYRTTLNGPAQKQPVNERTTCRVTQQGTAVGHFEWPYNFVPPPIWPDAEHEDERRLDTNGPKRHGDNFAEYELRWMYVFESHETLVGEPAQF